MTDIILLEQAIKDSGMSKKFIAQKMGINPASLRRKLKNEQEFWQGEIVSLCAVLRLTNQQMTAIFFNENVG